MFHSLWSCKVKCFWTWVHALVCSVTMVNIVKNPRIALPVEEAPRHTQSLIYFMFLAAENSHWHHLVKATGWSGDEAQAHIGLFGLIKIWSDYCEMHLPGLRELESMDTISSISFVTSTIFLPPPFSLLFPSQSFLSHAFFLLPVDVSTYFFMWCQTLTILVFVFFFG